MERKENHSLVHSAEGAGGGLSRFVRALSDLGHLQNNISIADFRNSGFSLDAIFTVKPVLSVSAICFIIGHYDRNSCMGGVTSSHFVYAYWQFSGFVLLIFTLVLFGLLRNILLGIPSNVLFFISVLFSTFFATKFVVFIASTAVPALSSCLSSDIYQVLVNASLASAASLPLAYIYRNTSPATASENLVGETYSLVPAAVDTHAIIELNGKTYSVEMVKLVQSESNYLHILVHTDEGARKILTRMTFKNFLSNVPPQIGIVFRRGGWVSRSFISSTKKRGGAIYLLFEDGTEARVGRKYSETRAGCEYGVDAPS